MSNEMVDEICAIYLPPQNAIVISYYKPKINDNLMIFWHDIFEYIYSTFGVSISVIITGDFNINFNLDTRASRDIVNVLAGYGVYRTIHSYTREHFNGTQTCIDNIFTNIPSYNAYTYNGHISDHLSLIIEEVYDAEKADEKFNVFLNTFCLYYNKTIPIGYKNNSTINHITSYEVAQIKETLDFIREVYVETRDEEMLSLYKSYKQSYLIKARVEKRSINENKIRQAKNRVQTTWHIINEETGKMKNLNSNNTPTAEQLNNFFSTIGQSTHDKVQNTKCSPKEFLSKIPIKILSLSSLDQ
ncbi:hypothetical protein WA026_022067 [Henosepilachna vigintioctopunctata]|uniref:Endonuclease/exonuclease/phosphatase domain-containing protein n=1 Tax=Henosepilachna vigintioctopunctata TaxID=420089 RepID=A0AAW1U3Y4_9CUCU